MNGWRKAGRRRRYTSLLEGAAVPTVTPVGVGAREVTFQMGQPCVWPAANDESSLFDDVIVYYTSNGRIRL